MSIGFFMAKFRPSSPLSILPVAFRTATHFSEMPHVVTPRSAGMRAVDKRDRRGWRGTENYREIKRDYPVEEAERERERKRGDSSGSERGPQRHGSHHYGGARLACPFSKTRKSSSKKMGNSTSSALSRGVLSSIFSRLNRGLPRGKREL